MNVEDPLTLFYRKHSTEGLMWRYAEIKTNLFWRKKVGTALWCGLVAFALSPWLGMVCFLLVCSGDLIDYGCLRLALRPNLPPSVLRRLRRVSVLSAILQSSLFGIAACLPLVFQLPDPDMWSPIFTISLLISAGGSNCMSLALHKVASAARLVLLFLAPVVVMLYTTPHLFDVLSVRVLDLAGIAIFLGSIFWLAVRVALRHRNSRRNHLKTAQQQQELTRVNTRLLEQEKAARQLALVAESANDSVMIMGPDGAITWVNDSFTRITGFSFREAVGRRPGELLNGEGTSPEIIEKLQRSIKNATPIRLEICNRRKDGAQVWLETSQVPMVNVRGDLETLIAVERDITETKKHETEMEQARLAAEEGARSKAEFLATMSHEIRTPLNGVIGMAQLLEQADLGQEQREQVETIRSSAGVLLGLINDILDLSRLDAQEMQLCVEDFDLKHCLESCLRLLHPLAAEKGIGLRLDLDPTLMSQLRGDDRRLTQVLVNIIGNAIKFTEEGEVVVRAASKVSSCGVELQFSVTDTGIGIDEDKLKCVFERFSQADAAISRRFGGTGLGLTISQKLVRAMGGEISVASTLGQGSEFNFSIYVQKAQKLVQPRPEVVESSDLSHLRILIAEDNKVNRVLVDKFLKQTNALRAFALDGAEAIEMTKSFKPDLILMDVSMPEVNGLEATRAIRQLPISQPHIIALTANAFEEDRKACFQAGMDDFMTKPLNRSDLLERLSQVSQSLSKTRAH